MHLQILLRHRYPGLASASRRPLRVNQSLEEQYAVVPHVRICWETRRAITGVDPATLAITSSGTPSQSQALALQTVSTGEAFHDPADVDQMHLSALAGVGGVDHDAAAVGAEARMRVAPPLAGVLGRRLRKMPEPHAAAGRHVVEVNVLVRTAIGIGVVDESSCRRAE